MEKHGKIIKNLRKISKTLSNKFPALKTNKFVCDYCRKALSESTANDDSDVEMVETGFILSPRETDSDFIDPEVDKEAAISHLNNCLKALQESPIRSDEISTQSKKDDVIKKVISALVTKLFAENDFINEEYDILLNLKGKFKEYSGNKSFQQKILSILPKTWTVTKIQKQFQCSNRMARNAKKAISNNEFLLSPSAKTRNQLPAKTSTMAKDYYKNDDNSRVMPGKADFVSFFNEKGEKVKEQKRLVLCNLKELHRSFKDTYPEQAIGFSKFAELRPKECILAGGSGSHTVCVCAKHQNLKLMFVGGRINELCKKFRLDFPSYQHWIAQSICNPPQVECYLGLCTFCPGDSVLKNQLLKSYVKSDVDKISFKQWIQVDRSNLITVEKPVDEFVDLLSQEQTKLILHSFIAAEQNKFLSETKNNLLQGELVLICDFAENYSFIVQDSIQSFHWSNNQATIHPFVVYFRNCQNQLEHINFVLVSDILEHNTIAVHLFQKKLMNFLNKKLFLKVKKLFYFSDGSAAQYKNRKNFANILHHEEDFGCPAEWHFFATSHGKGPCDGVGGALKRAAAKASLQRPYNNQILSAHDLYLFAKDLEKLHVDYCSYEEYNTEKHMLQERFENSITVPGTQKLHAIIPFNKSEIKAKIFSNDIDRLKPLKVIKN